MLTIRVLLLGLLFAISSIGFAESQRPVPSPAKAGAPQKAQSRGSEQASASDQRGTDKSPLVIKIVPINPEAKAADHPKEGKEKSSAEWWLVVFNGMLVVVVFLQWFWMVRQEKWMKDNVETAKTSAEAAKKSAAVAEAGLAAAMRPKIIVREFSLTEFKDDRATIEYSAYNQGGSDAMCFERNVTVIITADPTLPAKAPYDQGKTFEVPTKLPPGVYAPFVVTFEKPLTGDYLLDSARRLLVESGSRVLYVLGYVMYKDRADIVRRTHFCRRYHSDTKIFSIVEHPDFESAD